MNNRTLYRPMFRRGGKVDSRGTGITTGLMPRKNYAQGDLVTGPGGMSEGDTINYMNQQNPNINTTLGVNSDYDSISELMSTKQDLRDEFGLNYEIPEPEKGLSMSDYVNIFGTGADILLSQNPDTVGEKVKETAGGIASNIDKRKIKEQQDIEKAFGVTSSDFESAYKNLTDKQKSEYDRETLLEVQKEKNKSDASGKTYMLEVRSKMLEEANIRMDKINESLRDENLSDDAKKDLMNEKRRVMDDIDNLKRKDNTILNYVIDLDKEQGGELNIKIKKHQSLQAQLREANKVVVGPESIFQSQEDKRLAEKSLEDKIEAMDAEITQIVAGYTALVATLTGSGVDYKAEGGRVGLQQGGMSNQQANSVEMPSYQLLRSQLPPEISDEVVKLISMSPQALAAFAEIETEQDVANFNNTFQTNLVIPAGS